MPPLARVALVLAAALSLTACGNTIRGAGRDVANTVDATGDAARNVANAPRR